ncbi:hypothetical protein IEQ34_000220 [Dendrobium chrysotoxum]|uniref:Uncharacterized protein n=1 Tax=Dendrobium chrysotoxum TaxID=161865 RepID=A0AAV7HPW1_DENCH|nr:hypothetical protein IEQ34_000220 [Dendrobium chrysotoxum]
MPFYLLVMLTVFIGPKGYCYTYMMPCWVLISMESVSALVAMDLLEVVKERGVDVKLELSLGLSSGEVECKKWVRETIEIVIVKKPKMEEGLMPYCLQVMPIVFIGPKRYYYAYMMPYWVLISMKVIGYNLYKPRDNLSLALEMNGVRETNETIVVKKPKMEEGLVPYYSQVMSMVPIFMKVVGIYLYEPRDNSSLALETDSLELSLGLSSGKVECKKWVTETIESVIVKKPKMEEGPMPYYLYVPISVKVVGNNLYEPRDNLSLALEMDGLEQSAQALLAMDLFEVAKECGVDVRLELPLKLSSGKVECKKWMRETNEIVIVKKPKMKERRMPYYLLVMLTIFIGPKGYCYA